MAKDSEVEQLLAYQNRTPEYKDFMKMFRELPPMSHYECQEYCLEHDLNRIERKAIWDAWHDIIVERNRNGETQ